MAVETEKYLAMYFPIQGVSATKNMSKSSLKSGGVQTVIKILTRLVDVKDFYSVNAVWDKAFDKKIPVLYDRDFSI